MDRAVDTLRNAARDAPDVEVLTSLATAHFARAHLRSDPIDLMRGLGAVERARHLRPDDLAVLFNRALILDRLHLLAMARQAWEAYLAADATGPWAEEARRRLAAVPADGPAEGESGDVPSGPQEVREWLQNTGLGEWATAAAHNPQAAPPLLDRARARARELREVTGDGLLARSIGVIDTAIRQGDRATLDRLIRGHRFYHEGSALMRDRSFSEAESVLRAARRELAAAGSPFAGWAEFLVMRCAYQRQQYDAMEEQGRRILAQVEEGGASALRGRTWWVLGSGRFGSGELRAADEAFRNAVEEFARLGESRNELAVRYRHAGLLEWIGRVEDAWQVRYETLTALRSRPEPRPRRLIAIDLAYSALDLGEPEAALALQGEAVAVARAGGRPQPLANALLKRAGLRQRAGRLSAAERSVAEEELAEASRAVDRIGDDGPRQALVAKLRLEQGRLWWHVAPQRAAAALDEALDLHAEGQTHLLVPEVQLVAARVERSLGRPDVAEAQLRASLAELDRQRATVSTDYERIELADRAAEAYDELVDLLLEQGRPRDALLAAERGRARRLREWWERAGAKLQAPAIPSADGIGPTAAHLAYAVLPHRLAIWLLTDTELHSVTVPVSAPALRDLVRDLRSAIQADSPAAKRHLSELYDILIAPIAGDLADKTDLRVVPDEQLFLLPFHALFDPETGRYLLEDHRITVSPTLEGPEMEGVSPPARAPRSVLVVADPAFDRVEHPTLRRLPGAIREGLTIVAEYEEARVLQGDEATIGAFWRHLDAAEVLHIAAHAISNRRDPFLSSLVFAPEGDSSDEDLYARQILDAQVPMPEFVVLAACRSMGTEVSSSEGMLGLAWAFLARGANKVVATLWEVDDAASQQLFHLVHRQTVAGDHPAEALRTSQVSALRAGVELRTWAAAVLFTSQSYHRDPG